MKYVLLILSNADAGLLLSDDKKLILVEYYSGEPPDIDYDFLKISTKLSLRA